MLAALLLAAALAAPAQREVEVWGRDPAPDLSVAYRGTGWALQHPGLAARVDWRLRAREVRVPDAQRRRTRTWAAGAELGASAHIYNNTLVWAQGVGTTRLARTSGFTTGWTVGAGVGRAFLNHPTWRLADDGRAQRVWLRGQWSGVATVGWEIGWELQRWRQLTARRPPPRRPLQWFIRPTFGVMAPWMDLATPVAHVDIGVRTAWAAWRGLP